MFDDNSYKKAKYEFETRKDGYYVTIEKMYDYVSFQNLSMLQGYLKMAEILGCTNGDEIGRKSYDGCETCDYGSRYIIKMKFW